MKQWLEKLNWKLGRFMQGRNGQDSLSRAMTVGSLLLLLLAVLFGTQWLTLAALIFALAATLRCYSKNLAKRRAENASWQKLTLPVRRWWRRMKNQWAERKTHRYFKCPKCGQYLRVPRGKGKIQIACKSCGERFLRKT